ncbi:MAG: hypothetical protein AAF797_00675 [Planctomycetota bacterium]
MRDHSALVFEPLEPRWLLSSTAIDDLFGSNLGGNTTAANRQARLALMQSEGIQKARLGLLPGKYWNTGTSSPTPQAIDDIVLDMHAANVEPVLLFEYYDDYYNRDIRDFDWYAIGSQFAERFKPGSSWLQSQGITGWGINIYTAINEPDLELELDNEQENTADPGDTDNKIPFNDYHWALENLADGVHASHASAEVLPGGYAGAIFSGNPTMKGYLSAVADLLNDGTLAGVDTHRYQPDGKFPRFAHDEFFAIKSANNITADIKFYVSEFNRNLSTLNPAGMFIDTLDMFNVPATEAGGDGSAARVGYVMPWSLHATDSQIHWGLASSLDPWTPNAEGEAFLLAQDLLAGTSYASLEPTRNGLLKTAGSGKTVWVWFNIKSDGNRPAYATNEATGSELVLMDLPPDATSLSIYRYDGYQSSGNHTAYQTVSVTPGQDWVKLTNLPAEEVIVIVANSETAPVAPTGWKIDFEHRSSGAIATETANGFTPVTDDFAYGRVLRAGWSSGYSIYSRDLSGTGLTGDSNRSSRDETFMADLAPGSYHVTLHMESGRSLAGINAEGQQVFGQITTTSTPLEFDVTVNDGRLDLEFIKDGWWGIHGLEITANAPNLGIFESTRDIGVVAAAGSADSSGGVYTLTGSGRDIWNTSDEFRYLYDARSGDGTITARVDALTNTHAAAKAGVMIRDSPAANAKFVDVMVLPDGRVSMRYRGATGGSAQAIGGTPHGPTGLARWVRLTKLGDDYTGEYSTDGLSWNTIDSVNLNIGGAPERWGLAVTSHNDGVLATAQFSEVSIGDVALPGLLDFSSTSFSSYSGSQDGSGGHASSLSVEDGGATVHLTGNAWKKTALNYSVTASTVLSFEVNATDTGELIGIGLDSDNNHTNRDTLFVLGGSQSVPNDMIDYPGNYQAGDGWVTFTIDIGAFYIGSMSWLTFLADDDADGSADVRFRNIRVYEA